MKKALLIGIFSFLVLAPFQSGLAQTGGDAPAVKAVEKASMGVPGTTDQRKIPNPAAEPAAGNATATNQTSSPTLAESTEAISSGLPGAASEAQRNYNAGVALYESGKLDEAIIAFKEANKLDPIDPQTHYMLGMVYWKAKAFNDSVDSFKRAVRLKPDWAEAYFRLGLTYYVLGRKIQSNEAYKKLLELKSPLANKLYRINNVVNRTNVGESAKAESAPSTTKEVEAVPVSAAAEANRTNVYESPKAEPAPSTTKQDELVPVSASAPVASLNEKPPATASESNGSSITPASSSNAIPAGASSNETPSPAGSELHSSSINVISSPATATVPASESNSASATPASSSNAIPAAASSTERPSPAVSELHSSSTTAISSPATATVPASESNSASATAISPATATATAPVTETAKGDHVSSSKAIATDDAALTDIYKVGVGDVLDIRLLNSAANRSTLYSVIEGGLIDFPIAGGPIRVSGLTIKDIQARITSELKRLAVEERTQVAVGVRQYASHTVIITGLVSIPGTKILRREAVPLYVLLAEVQPRLDAGRAAIMRAGTPTQVVDLSESAALNFIVRPGDVINLTARPPDFYYIGGRISSPGQKLFQPGITLVQAILAAGGLARDNEVELSREGSDGRLATTTFNLKEIKSGKIQDPKLQPGDRIEVFH